MTSGLQDVAAIERAVRAAVAVVAPGKGDIDRNTELMAQAGLSSLQVMDMIMEIEDALDISVPVSVVGEVRTIAQLVAALETLVAEQNP
jgi:acyl carrier protein